MRRFGVVAVLVLLGLSVRAAQARCLGPSNCVCTFVPSVQVIEGEALGNGQFRVLAIVREYVSGGVDAGAPFGRRGDLEVASRATSIDASPHHTAPYAVGDTVTTTRDDISAGGRWVVALRTDLDFALQLDAEGRIICPSANERITLQQLVTVLSGNQSCTDWASQNLTSPPCNDTGGDCSYTNRSRSPGTGVIGALIPAAIAILRRRRRASTHNV